MWWSRRGHAAIGADFAEILAHGDQSSQVVRDCHLHVPLVAELLRSQTHARRVRIHDEDPDNGAIVDGGAQRGDEPLPVGLLEHVGPRLKDADRAASAAESGDQGVAVEVGPLDRGRGPQLAEQWVQYGVRGQSDRQTGAHIEQQVGEERISFDRYPP